MHHLRRTRITRIILVSLSKCITWWFYLKRFNEPLFKVLVSSTSLQKAFSHNQFTKDIVQIQYGLSGHCPLVKGLHIKGFKTFQHWGPNQNFRYCNLFHAQIVANNKVVEHFVWNPCLLNSSSDLEFKEGRH